MADTDYLESASGSAGNLKGAADSCHVINDAVTAILDRILGPDGTDAFDASCNTCKHFQRERFARKERLVSVWGFPGTCGKTGEKTTGWPRGQYCGMSCYENRRTGENNCAR